MARQVARAARLAVVLALVAVPLVVALPAIGAAQEKSPRIGALLFRPRAASPFAEVFSRTLRELGYDDSRVEYRFAEGNTDRLPALAAELVRLNVDAIVAADTPAVLAAKNATKTIPIVIVSGDPVAMGLVASLARPGGNITGISSTAGEPGVKHVDILRAVLPRATRMGGPASS